MSRFHDDTTAASDPVGVRLDPKMLDELHRLHRGWWGRVLDATRAGSQFRAILDEHLRLGDSRAAVVISAAPLVVAAYTDELDCVVNLRFAGALVERFSLRKGDRLLTVNTYTRGAVLAPDLTRGPKAFDRYVNFWPVIAEFVSRDQAAVERRKRAIEDWEWTRTVELGDSLFREAPTKVRDGSPFHSKRPAPT